MTALRLAANVSLLYPECAFLDRFAAAAADGFAAVECLFPYDHAPEELAQCLRASGLQQVLINAPPGDWAAGERGIACLPGRDAEFREGVDRALHYARVLQCPRVHVLAGLAPAELSPQAATALFCERLQWAARRAAPFGVDILIEPINMRDFPGYLLNRQEHAHALLTALDLDNLKVQMDLYHCQIVEGDVAMKLRRYLPTGKVGHIQIAGVPARHEPDLGELNYAYLFALLRELDYRGWIGCEYRPARGAQPGGTRQGLGWRTALGAA